MWVYRVLGICRVSGFSVSGCLGDLFAQVQLPVARRPSYERRGRLGKENGL